MANKAAIAIIKNQSIENYNVRIMFDKFYYNIIFIYGKFSRIYYFSSVQVKVNKPPTVNSSLHSKDLQLRRIIANASIGRVFNVTIPSASQGLLNPFFLVYRSKSSGSGSASSCQNRN